MSEPRTGPTNTWTELTPTERAHEAFARERNAIIRAVEGERSRWLQAVRALPGPIVSEPPLEGEQLDELVVRADVLALLDEPR